MPWDSRFPHTVFEEFVVRVRVDNITPPRGFWETEWRAGCMVFAILDFLILPGSHLTSVSIQKLKFLFVSCLMMPNLGPWPL